MRRSTVLGLSAAVAILAAGCSSPVVPTVPSRIPSSAPASNAPSGSANPSGQPTPTDPGQPTPADPGQPTSDTLGNPVVSRSASVDGSKVVMTLYPVFRDGTTSHVNLTVTAPDDGEKNVQIAQTFSDANGSASDTSGDTADGVQLIDVKNAKLYLVASDGKGNCLCSRNLSNLFLENELPAIISATFAAPPADVTAVNILIPHFGTVKNVPVQ